MDAKTFYESNDDAKLIMKAMTTTSVVVACGRSNIDMVRDKVVSFWMQKVWTSDGA